MSTFPIVLRAARTQRSPAVCERVPGAVGRPGGGA